MTTVDRLRRWHEAGIIGDAQYAAIAAIVRKERFSLFLELNALLYLGVLSLAGGLVWTCQTYFTNLGDPFILTTLSLLWAGCLYYCYSHALPYSNGKVESPHLAFDYVLYLGCLALLAEVGYVEFRFQLLRDAWNYYLLFTAAAFGLLAYRFDNRFVLSLALTSLAGWFGVKVTALLLASPDTLRASALMYGAFVAAAGTTLHRRAVKPHFLDAYLQIAANVAFVAVLSGLRAPEAGAFYLLALIGLSAASIALGVGTTASSISPTARSTAMRASVSRCWSASMARRLHSATFLITGTLVVILLVMVARRFGRDE
jgi:hypothetical protein